MNQKMTDLKGEMDKPTSITGYFGTLLLALIEKATDKIH